MLVEGENYAYSKKQKFMLSCPTKTNSNEHIIMVSWEKKSTAFLALSVGKRKYTYFNAIIHKDSPDEKYASA